MAVANPRGRQPIGVDQPPSGGTNYPFVQPSTDIQNLLGDLFVSFDDFDDEYEFPLKVVWLYGFGTDVVAPPAGWPAPTHAQDIIVADANDVVVFDSTTATKFTADDWDSRLQILEWTTSDKILRCVRHTAWSQADIDAGITRTYDQYIEPTNGELQADTWYRLPKRIKSLTVGLTTASTANVITFNEGYNVGLSATPRAAEITPFLTTKTLKPGVRKTTALRIDANPGDGLGVLPGCIDQEPELKTINRITSNKYQNFTYDTEGCIRSQRPVGLNSLEPREFDYASLGLSASEAKSAIETLNDCQNCCDCTYFAQTYQGLKRQWFLYRNVATAAEQTRDLFSLNINRWEVQKEIRKTATIRTRVNPDGNCKVSWGFAHCNPSRCCIFGMTAHITFLYYINGILTFPVVEYDENGDPYYPYPFGYACGKAEIDGSDQCNNRYEKIVLQVHPSGMAAKAYWTYADPQSVTTVRERFCFPDCKNLGLDELKVQMHVSVSIDNAGKDPASGEDSVILQKLYSERDYSGKAKNCYYYTLQEEDYPDDVLTAWNELGIPVPENVIAETTSELVSVSSHNPYCERCECTEITDEDTGTSEFLG